MGYEIDIRDYEPDEITTIVFGDQVHDGNNIELVTGNIRIYGMSKGVYVTVAKPNLKDFIKALQKAEELGWGGEYDD